MVFSLKVIVRIFLFCVILCLLSEFTFRFLIPAPELPYAYFDTTYQIIRYDTSVDRGWYTNDRLGITKTAWHINNAGWNSDEPYNEANKRLKPLIAIVGDSYIEGFLVDAKDHLASQLKSLTQDRYDIYEFGTSGVNMAQFINVFNYVQKEFAPDIVLFFINDGDLLESTAGMASSPNNLQFNANSTTISPIAPQPYRPVLWKRIVRKSAFARYVFFYFQFKLRTPEFYFIKDNKATKSEKKTPNRDTENPVLKIVASKIVDSIKTINAHAEVIFVLHPDRRRIYELPSSVPALAKEINVVQTVCQENSIKYINLNEAFYKDFVVHKKEFNFKNDWHWNAYGNKVAAKEIVKALAVGIRNDSMAATAMKHF